MQTHMAACEICRHGGGLLACEGDDVVSGLVLQEQLQSVGRGNAVAYLIRAGRAALAAQVREILHVQFRVPGMGVGMPLGKFDQFAEKTAPYKIFKRHGPRSLERNAAKSAT